MKSCRRSLVIVLTLAMVLAGFVVARGAAAPPDWYFAPVEAAEGQNLLYTATYVQDGVSYSVQVPTYDPPIPAGEIRDYACELIRCRVGYGLEEDFMDRVVIEIQVQ